MWKNASVIILITAALIIAACGPQRPAATRTPTSEPTAIPSAAPAEETAEVTAEASAETTAEATPEVTVETESTAEATPDVTAAPTSESEGVSLERYEGRFSFNYPGNWELQEGTNLVRLSNNDGTILVAGPTHFEMVIGSVLLETDTDRLAFFLDRSGYTPGEAVSTDQAAIAAVEVSLPRRNQTGTGYLVDLDNGRQSVIVALSTESDIDDATRVIIDSIIYPPDLIDIARRSGDFSTLLAAVEAAGIADVLTEGSVTLFAPTDAAFAETLDALGISAEDLLADTTMLTDILSYHVIGEALSSEELVSKIGEPVNTLLAENPLTFSMVDGGLVINEEVGILTADITASSGILHVIDSVLLPASVIMTQEGAEATPEATPEATADASAEEQPVIDVQETRGSIVEALTTRSDLTTLMAFIASADLVSTLGETSSSFILFAPTNDAFADTLAELELGVADLVSTPDTLRGILTYHVVASSTADDILSSGDYPTLNGATVTLNVSDSQITINNQANVVSQIITQNGLIFVIDGVLLPPES